MILLFRNDLERLKFKRLEHQKKLSELTQKAVRRELELVELGYLLGFEKDIIRDLDKQIADLQRKLKALT